MAFKKVNYESDTLGLIIRAKLSEGELAVAGTPPAASADAQLTVYGSGSRKRHGVHARGVRLTRVVGTAPNTFTKSTFLTCVSAARYAELNAGDSVTISGTAWTVSDKVPETAK